MNIWSIVKEEEIKLAFRYLFWLLAFIEFQLNYLSLTKYEWSQLKTLLTYNIVNLAWGRCMNELYMNLSLKYDIYVKWREMSSIYV